MSERSNIAQALAAALPAELRPHAAEVAALLALAPAEVTDRLAARPVLGAALVALVGQTLEIEGRSLQIVGSVGTLQQVTISGGYVERIIGTSITIQLPPTPHVVDPAAQELLAALPLDTIPPVTPLPDLHRIPFARNPLFVGREADLRALARALKGEGSAAAIGQAAVSMGLGGIGKTNLATEFVHRYGCFFAGGVFWLSFADPATVPTEIAVCGAALDLPGFADLKLDEQVARVRAAWAQPLPRLLVFDNCDEGEPGQAEALIQQWRPATGGCRVLITSRRGSWSKSLGLTTLPLGMLSRPESIALLRKHRPDLAEDDSALDAIAAELGDLPLALHLAGSFLETYRNSPAFGDPAGFLAELRDARLLDHDALQGIDVTPSPTNHDLHVARTFALSYGRLEASDPVDAQAIRLLARAAYLAPGEVIPRDLLLATLELADDDRAGQREAERGLHRLVGLGLAEREGENALRLHRLLHVFASNVSHDVEAQGAVETVLIQTARHSNSTGDPRAMRPIATHLHNAMERACARDDELAASLCGNLAHHLKQIGDYEMARPLLEHALAIAEQVLDPEHPITAQSLNSLAALHYMAGDYEAARPLFERALAITERTLGPMHPDTAASLNNLAELVRAAGDYEAARPLLERALAIAEQALGPMHSLTAASLNSLGEFFRTAEDYGAARPFLERALAIAEQALGPMHPQTATCLNNLALLLKAAGDYRATRPLLERALDIAEQTLGPMHPQTATSLNNLALLLQQAGDVATARHYHERALAIRDQALGPHHPDTATSLWWLGRLLAGAGDRDSARAHLQRAVAIYAHTLGLAHPTTRQCQQQLASLDAPPPEVQIAQIRQQAEAAVAQALGGNTPEQRAALAHRLEEVAGQIERNEQGDGWTALATHLRALKARLEPSEPPEYTALRERAEAAVARALAEGGPEDRAALAVKLRVTADAYAAGLRPGPPALALAEQLRALAERLEAGEG